jgi:hypothetical protein
MRRRTKSAKEKKLPAIQANPGAFEIEQRLSEILSSLATVLVSTGYGIARLNRLTRRAYFDAALKLNTLRGGKVTNAQIAAQTGLTRTEVSVLARNGSTRSHLEKTPINRAQRVTLGWLSDSRFCKDSGTPNTLPFAGRFHSFSRLVKIYSGDIPAKAMLLEMRRLGMVKIVGGGAIKLVNVGISKSRHAVSTLRAMNPWISFLASNELTEGFAVCNQHRIRLHFSSKQQSLAALRELKTRSKAFAKSIEELASKKRPDQSHSIDVSFAIGASQSRDNEKLMNLREGNLSWMKKRAR